MRVGNREIRFSNPNKMFFPEPGLTKGDLLRYYVDVAPYLLHHVRNRPMQMLRYPDGVDGFRFYQEVPTMQKEHSSADTGGRRWPNRPPSPPLTSSSTRSSSGTRHV
jgi:DNA primase